MKQLLLTLFLAFDAYLGTRFLLNVIGILQTSKYSKGATLFYAIAFLTLAAAGAYYMFVKQNFKITLLLAIGPWILIVLFLFINMIFGDYK
ncbi:MULTISPECIES: hypothetical protein [unclassified Paraflavitalea]|uniref:hypothetical protein n=1 Tax=unclassified Paraflavitalea TaxID=2798305 RepID=UPI003D34D6DD